MSEIQREAQRWGAVYAEALEGLSAIGNQFTAGFRIAREVASANQRARLVLGNGVDADLAMARAHAVSMRSALSYPEALRREVEDVLNPPRASVARSYGWDDLAEVIQTQEGRRIVRDGMRDVRVWLGEGPAITGSSTPREGTGGKTSEHR